MKCARCGYIRKKIDDHFFRADECPSCGVLYDKNADNISSGFSMDVDGSEPAFRPSPVDAESLKKARQRVEKRLKENLSAQKSNPRHDQTLELARRFASEGVRKRQEQWKQQQTDLQESDESVLAKAMEKRRKAIHSSDAEADAGAESIEILDMESETDAGAESSEILDMESESENTIQKSWFVPPGEAAEQALSAATADSKPVLDDHPQTNDDQPEFGRGHQRKRWRWVPGGGLARLLPLVAWLILVAGISGAILSWTTMGEAEAGIKTQQMVAGNSINLGLLLGFAYLVTGVLGFAFFWVSSLISRELKDIRRLLLLQPIPRSESKDGC